MNFESKIRMIKDFPKEGIEYMDITTLLKDGDAFHDSVDACIELVKDLNFNKVVGPEARGFILGTPISYATKTGFVPVRKPGKLPAKTLSYTYDLEYGTDTLEIHADAIEPGDKVLIADDLLATGGTVEAVVKMVEKLGGEVVGMVFLIELGFLNGKDKLTDYKIKSLIKK
ncbi:adenine phosphoribosyltransferase [Clostridiaceae bacterium HSG29]|nr:adenine phosphoribosyltransferase [Clostridiaceae bacterium HSG29]